MRILFLTFYFEPDLCAGSFRNTPLFRELLQQAGVNGWIHVITTQPNRYNSFHVEGQAEVIKGNYRINRIRIPEHKSGFIDQAKSFRVYYKEALRLTRKERYDLVYASSSRLFTAFLGRRIAGRQGIPLYLDIRDIFVDTIKDVFRGRKMIQIPAGICFILLVPLTYFVYRMVEKSRLPEISHDDTILTIDWNSGISLEENDLRVYRLLAQVDSLILQSTSMVGVQQFLMSHTREITPSESVIYMKAKDAGKLVQVERIISDYLASNYPKARASFQVSGNIFNMIFAEKGSTLVAQLHSKEGQAPTVEQVTRVVDKVKKALPGVGIPPAVMEQNIRYIADVEAMAIHEVTFNDVYGKMKNIISQNTLFRINQGGYSVPVTTGDTQAETSDILSGKVRNRHGIEIPLSMIIRETKGEDFKKLYSGNGGDYYPVVFDVDDREVGQVMKTVEEVVREDQNFFVTFTGEYFSSRETIRELIVILLVAISLLYFILAAQFESVIQPLIILSEIVVDIFFVLFGLWLFGESLNIMSMIGLVVMSGIIINDSILKVDTINRLRKSGMSLLRAVFIAGHSRLKPIIMTSLTTILAIAPFLNRVDMGSDLQYPLSLSIIIGMSFGTVVSLFFIPLLYYVIYRKR